MAATAASGNPYRARSRLPAATAADTPPGDSISLMSEAPPKEGAFSKINQSRCFVTAPFAHARGFPVLAGKCLDCLKYLVRVF
jgi:hypothetical protein